MIDTADLQRLRESLADDLARVTSDRDLQAVRDRYLARRTGLLAELWGRIAKAPADERPALGRLANELKQHVEASLDARRASLPRAGAVERVDVTLPGRQPVVGHRHPLMVLRDRIEEIFGRMGFEIVDGPETEDEDHNFEMLNMPADHPSRDMQDTLYLRTPLARPVPAIGRQVAPCPTGAGAPATLLRTHTSTMQIRYMRGHQPPLRIIAPGRVYRRDNLDLTHTPMFQQVEGLVVGEGITLADLKGTLTAFLRELFDSGTPVMFRPSYFPYTEPSAEVFIGCLFCARAGCAVCKRTGWLEILGSGMVHPAVFEAVGYDTERYTGFAWGMGIERIAMLKYRVDDIRVFYENDLRLLEQFPL